MLSIAQEFHANISGGVKIDIIKEQIGTEYILKAAHRVNRIELSAKIPSSVKEGRYDNITMAIYGIETKNYPLGVSAARKYNTSGSDLGTATLTASYHTQTDRVILTDNENATGFIRVTSFENYIISGVFEAQIDGKTIKGAFKDIEVQK